MIIITLAQEQKASLDRSRKHSTQNLTTVTPGPGLQTQWVRNLAQWGPWHPREQSPHHRPQLLPGGKAASRKQIAQCLKRSPRSGWWCAMCQSLSVGNLLHFLFKLCCPPTVWAIWDRLSGQVWLLDFQFWPLVSIVFFIITLIPDYFKCFKIWLYYFCICLCCALF